jgi:iron complex outermembrane recepter protein
VTLASTIKWVLVAAAAGSLSAHNAAEAAEAQGGIEEVVVTATKQVQNLQRTPAAITAIDSAAIVTAGVTDIRGAQNLVPSVRFQPQNAATEIYMRGVGSTIDLPNIESPTSLNFNGIYIPREVSAVPFFDMANIEVLPGPQGTLYGRGSLGGIVNATYARPTDANEGFITAEAGNYSLAHVTAVGNVTASDTLSFRAGVDYAKADGYLKSGANSTDNITARVSLTAKPSDTVEIYAWSVYSRRKGDSNNVVTVGVDPLTGNYSPGSFLRDDPWDDTRTPGMLALPANPNLPPPSAPVALPTDGKTSLTGAEIAVKLGDATLTWIPSYLKADVDVAYFFGAYPTDKYDEAKQWTQELRLNGEIAGWTYLAGIYAYSSKTSGTFTITGFPIAIVDENKLRGQALFGQATHALTDRSRFTVGGRFSQDKRDGSGTYTGFQGANFVVNVPYDYAEKFNHADFKVGAEFDATDSAMLYAAVQSGYQPGTFNTYPSVPTASNAVKSAKLVAVTAGAKSRWMDNRLQVNTEFFYYDYKDLFASAYNTVLNTTQTFNAQKVEIYGNQLDVLFRPTDADQLRLSIGYLHARNKKFELPDGTANFNGLQLQYAPDWTISAGYHHDFQLGAGFLRAQFNTRFESSYFSDFYHTPGGKQDSYTKTDASLTYYGADERWSVALWAKNLEDEAVFAATAGGSSSPLQPLAATTNLEPPRTYGVRVNYKF